MAQTGIMAIEEFDEAVKWQADHAEKAGAACTARIIRSLPKVRESDTELGRRMREWAGLTLKDAMPLRVTGGLHHLALTGVDDRLVPAYSGDLIDQAQIDAIVLDMVVKHDAALAPWLDGPPQTNEAGRSASIMAGLLWLAQRVVPRFELFELGASAGVNTMMDRYFYDLGGTREGSERSPMRIRPEWRGKGAPPVAPDDFAILSVRGCDVSPINLSDPAAALRLKSYVWPEAAARMGRIEAAIQLAGELAPDVVEKDAGEFVAEMLLRPQVDGTTRAMFHSIMWQYMPAATQDAITALFEEVGAKATRDRPLAWVSLETNPETFRHELHVRYWDGTQGAGEAHLLAFAHPHGEWVQWGDLES
ncbi:MAG: DUF2332 domain-containing protein [Pseudomonadota bacterium]